MYLQAMKRTTHFLGLTHLWFGEISTCLDYQIIPEAGQGLKSLLPSSQMVSS